MKTLTLNEILSKNPQIDEKLLEKNRALREELQRMGVRSREYNLKSPFERKYKPVSKKDRATR